MKCKLETLTPCHIGSGNTLLKNLNFVVDGKGDSEMLGVISAERIYKALGEQGVDKWCQAIERKESVWSVVKTQNPSAKLSDICSKVAPLSRNEESAVCQELREHIASNGVLYIPGSSIKGAIVSAIVGESRAELSLPANIRNKNNNVAEQVLVKPTVNKKGEPRYDPKNSNLRFLRVSDAYFDNADIAVVECYGLNLRERGSLIDNKARMLVECINSEQQATVDIQVKTELQEKCSSAVPALPKAMQSEANLLEAINSHTKRLLKEELRFWNEQENRDYYHIDTDEEQEELEYYLDYIKYALGESSRCQSGSEAIIRVGYGSGWRFMTGSWIDDSRDEWDEIATIVRGDRGGRYQQYDFPKTRRVGLGTPFGFIKITKIE